MFKNIIGGEVSNPKLTGKTRYRILNRFVRNDLVVLQVEESYDDGIDDYNGMPTYLAGKRWRDAKPEDLQWIK